MNLFAPNILSGPVLYFDLDIFIHQKCDDLLKHYDHTLKLVHARWKHRKPAHYKIDPVQFNSSVMLFKAENTRYIWNMFYRDADLYMLKYHGMDRFLWYNCNQQTTYLPSKYFYSAYYGVDEKSPGPQKWYFEPNRMICLLNGVSHHMHEWELGLKPPSKTVEKIPDSKVEIIDPPKQPSDGKVVYHQFPQFFVRDHKSKG